MNIAISGTCDPAFGPVREALERNFADGGEVGEAVCVYLGQRKMVDLWAGHRNAARTLPWNRDTIVLMFSTCKPFATMAVLKLADRGLINLDEPVSAYWPEYAQAGKENTTVRHIVTHRAGLPGLLGLRNGDLYDWDTIIQAIEVAKPLLPSGRTGCYHTFTLGYLTGELVRRVTGKTIGRLPRGYAACRSGTFSAGVK